MKTRDALFANGFESWHETHFEIVEAITLAFERDEHEQPLRLQKIVEEKGRGGLYMLAFELTEKFETLHKGRLWDGDYPDVLEEYLDIEFAKTDL